MGTVIVTRIIVVIIIRLIIMCNLFPYQLATSYWAFIIMAYFKVIMSSAFNFVAKHFKITNIKDFLTFSQF